MAISSGTRVGPYEVVSPIGVGGMGEVYRCRDTRLARDVALKVLPTEVANDPARRSRFETEARAASALNHPGIITVFGIGDDNGVVYLATELIDGHSLRQVRPETLRRQLDIAAQIAEALAAAHAAGITHRDLKPENVMVTRDGRAKILDFGLARQAGLAADGTTVTQLNTQPGIVLGTIGYMSPEQARGYSVDHRSDIFSFGALLYELISGRRAFHGQSAMDIIGAILQQDPPELPPETPAAVRQIVSRCLEKEPDRRFQSTSDLAFALRALTGSTAAAVPPIAVARRQRTWLRWLPVPLAALVIGFVTHAWLFTPPYIDISKHRYRPLATNVGPQASWSPDGNAVVHTEDDEEDYRQLFIRNLDSPVATALTRDKSNKSYPVYSPDGRIYFLADNTAPRELWSISAAGGQPMQLLPSLGGPAFLDGIAISPDGNAVIVAKMEANGNPPMSLWISSPPGSTPTKYPGAPTSYRPYSRARLRFSPDGKTLLAMLYAESYEIWLLPWPPSSGKVRKTLPQISSWSFLSGADWLSDNRHILLSQVYPTGVGGRLWVSDVVSERMYLMLAETKYRSPRVHPNTRRVLVMESSQPEDAVEFTGTRPCCD
jgi:serine/threonine protein kinase